MHEGKIVNIQAVLGIQKFPQFLNILKRLLSKFHHFWSSFRPLLSFIMFSRAYTKPGAKQSFHISPSYPYCISVNKKSIATEFTIFGFLFDLLWFFKVHSQKNTFKWKIHSDGCHVQLTCGAQPRGQADVAPHHTKPGWFPLKGVQCTVSKV